MNATKVAIISVSMFLVGIIFFAFLMPKGLKHMVKKVSNQKPTKK